MDFQVTRLRCFVKKQLAIVWLISLATFAAVDPTLNSLQRARGAFEGQHILALSIPSQRVTRCARRIHELVGLALRSCHLSTPLATSSLVIRSKFPRSARLFSPSEAYPCCKANSSGFGSLRSFLLFWRLRFDACLNPR